MKIGKTSFTKEGYEIFKSKTKEEQKAYLLERMSPKDPVKAEKLLTHIPHGNKRSGDGKEVESSNTGDTKGIEGDSDAQPGTDTGKGKRVKKG